MKEIIIAKDISKIENITKDFSLELLRDINFTIYEGEFVSIVGRSGCGKSTLLRVILGEDKESDGKIFINNINIREMDENKLNEFRKKNIGICYQGLAPLVSSSATAKETIYHKLQYLCNKDIHQKYHDIVNTFNISSLENQKLHACSEMNLFRLKLAVAFCISPPIVIIDEVLDYFPIEEKNELLKTILNLQKKHYITLILVSHDLEIVKHGDRALYIRDKTMYEIDMNKLRRKLNSK